MNDFDNECQHPELLKLLGEFLGEPAKHYESKCQISYDCPNCSEMKGVESDGKGNLEINYGAGVYNCWSCSETHGTKGKLYGLFKEYAEPSTLRKFIAGKYKFNSEYYQFEDINIKKEILKLPEEFFHLSGKQERTQFIPAFNYLYYRGIDDATIDKYRIGFCLDGKYQNRVVIPSYDKDGELNYFVTRSISSKTKKYKYLNPDTDKTAIIFNELLIDWEKTVFLVEGVFDHIVIPNSIPLLGKKLYEKLFTDIYFKAKKYVIIVLDSDARDDAIKIFNKLDAGRLHNKILLNDMPEEHDISSFNQTYGNENLKKWLTNNNYKLTN